MNSRIMDKIVMAVLISSGIGGMMLYSELLARDSKRFKSERER